MTISSGTLRFNQLQKLLPNATPRMLTLQLRELEKQEDTFMEARLIGHIMNTYQLGIGDELLHQRIGSFIEKGLLQVVSPAVEGKLYTRRILKKNTEIKRSLTFTSSCERKAFSISLQKPEHCHTTSSSQ